VLTTVSKSIDFLPFDDNCLLKAGNYPSYFCCTRSYVELQRGAREDNINITSTILSIPAPPLSSRQRVGPSRRATAMTTTTTMTLGASGDCRGDNNAVVATLAPDQSGDQGFGMPTRPATSGHTSTSTPNSLVCRRPIATSVAFAGHAARDLHDHHEPRGRREQVCQR
jgi:hypothetical protein